MKSFRAQLILTIAGVVVAAMLILGFSIVTINANQLRANIDRELINRVEGFERGGPPFGRGPGGGPGFGPPQGGQNAPPPDDPNFFGSIRRPRIIPIGVYQGQGSPPSDIFDPNAAERASKGEKRFSNVKFGDEEVRVYSALVHREGQPDMVIQVARETRGISELKRVQISTLLIVTPLAIIGAVLVAVLLAGRVTKPISELNSAAQSIASGDLSVRIHTSGEDEFAQLGKQFNQMADNVDESMNRLKASLEQQQRFTADASHELRTPLTRLQLATSSGLVGGADEQMRALNVADQAGRDMTKLVDQLLALANADAGSLQAHFQQLDLRAVVADALAKTQTPISIELDEAPVIVLGDQTQLERVVFNLVENAVRYAPNGTISAKVHKVDSTATLTISDTGEGIPAEHLPHLTERFYRVDSARNRDAGGAGLGLAIVSEIVKAHGGEMKIKSEVGKGTAVTISLPIS